MRDFFKYHPQACEKFKNFDGVLVGYFAGRH